MSRTRFSLFYLVSYLFIIGRVSQRSAISAASDPAGKVF